MAHHSAASTAPPEAANRRRLIGPRRVRIPGFNHFAARDPLGTNRFRALAHVSSLLRRVAAASYPCRQRTMIKSFVRLGIGLIALAGLLAACGASNPTGISDSSADSTSVNVIGLGNSLMWNQDDNARSWFTQAAAH